MSQRLDILIEDELEEFLGENFTGLAQEKRLEFFKLYKKHRKTEAIYVYWFFNLHYAYVKKWLVFIVFIFTFGGLCLWWLLDLFRLNTILKEYNSNKAKELFEKFVLSV
jgi:hypothetical protein